MRATPIHPDTAQFCEGRVLGTEFEDRNETFSCPRKAEHRVQGGKYDVRYLCETHARERALELISR